MKKTIKIMSTKFDIKIKWCKNPEPIELAWEIHNLDCEAELFS
jgi:hypothetical protein